MLVVNSNSNHVGEITFATIKAAIPLPDDAKLIVFNGTDYVVYEDGDELPVVE